MIKHTLLSVNDFRLRREKLFASLPDNSIAVFAANNEVTRSNDTEYLFCQDKNFYYLTGFNEPDALLVMVKSAQNSCYLFCREKDELQEVWHGRRIGQENAKADYGFDHAYTLADIEQMLPELINGKAALYYLQGANPSLDLQVASWLKQVKAGSRTGNKAPQTLVDAKPLLDDMRLFKSENELTIMRQVNVISGGAHQRAMEKSAVGKFEYQIEAEILHEFARHGARFAAYNSIVAGGDNANILHYTDNCEVLADNDLLLIDAGGELAGYAADITRTFPINGKFTDAQKAIYQLVLDSQIAAIEAIKPGCNFAHLNTLVGEILTTGLYDLGILQGDLAELINENACKKYFIHGLGHWLGLDVHDVGDYQANDKREQLRAFETGMVMTIEPGIYIPATDESVDAKWRGIGVRIEDNIAVTDQGHENLTVNAPKSVHDIEALMARS
ncbi:Xaa-Pro aminopeptidase [Thalassotalea sp. PLHSN55]|uniref:Xaa-Pro aminopeptidase n=1 Tax=Thalassotalea sp. PLHSN55 TaxID=3435888 RepID=UPI003F83A396